MLYDAYGVQVVVKQVELVGEPVPVVVHEVEEEVKTMSAEELELEELKAKLAELQGNKSNAGTAPDANVPKNHREVKADPNRKYFLLSKKLAAWGRVPAQQAALAEIVSAAFEVGEPVGEVELFAELVASRAKYPCLCGKQSVTYLWCYYRGLKNDSKHAGFIARNFIRVVG